VPVRFAASTAVRAVLYQVANISRRPLRPARTEFTMDRAQVTGRTETCILVPCRIEKEPPRSPLEEGGVSSRSADAVGSSTSQWLCLIGLHLENQYQRKDSPWTC
jgi:hypothetical protein